MSQQVNAGFNMELRSQREWSWLLVIDLFLGGLGGGLYLVYEFFHLPAFVALLSIGLVMAGGAVLLSELGHPLRAWRAIARPRTSWISRGVLCVTVFVLAGSLSVAPAFTAFSWLPWSEESLAGSALGIIAGLCALMIILYPGFILSAPRSIPFWNTPFIPVLFLTHSLMGASGIVLLASPVGALQGSLSAIESLAAVLIVVNLAMISIFLFAMNHGGLSARESVRLINQAPLGRTFRLGVLLVGMIIPLGIVLWLRSAVYAAGAGILIGGILFRYCVLKAGVYVPSALVGLDMSRLKPSTSELEREYASMAARGHGWSFHPPGRES